MEDQAKDWEQAWDEESQRFYFFNRVTWETSYTTPFRATVSYSASYDLANSSV